jgi:hypothetical protein
MNTNLVNGQNVIVKFADGRDGLIVLKKLSIRQIYQFVECMTKDKTPELVALCIDQDVEFIDTLSDESFAELAKAAIAANFPRAMKLAQSDQVIAAKIFPVLQQLATIGQSLQRFQKDVGEIMKNSSPVPALAASATATGSGSST